MRCLGRALLPTRYTYLTTHLPTYLPTGLSAWYGFLCRCVFLPFPPLSVPVRYLSSHPVAVMSAAMAAAVVAEVVWLLDIPSPYYSPLFSAGSNGVFMLQEEEMEGYFCLVLFFSLPFVSFFFSFPFHFLYLFLFFPHVIRLSKY